MTCPFTDPQGMVEYAQNVWLEDQSRGPAMEQVINNLCSADISYPDIFKIRPDQYQALYDGLEALRG